MLLIENMFNKQPQTTWSAVQLRSILISSHFHIIVTEIFVLIWPKNKLTTTNEHSIFRIDYIEPCYFTICMYTMMKNMRTYQRIRQHAILLLTARTFHFDMERNRQYNVNFQVLYITSYDNENCWLQRTLHQMQTLYRNFVMQLIENKLGDPNREKVLESSILFLVKCKYKFQGFLNK